MPEVFGLATTFTIVSLTGERTTLSLAGRALPHRPYTLSGSMNAEFTWYPGNPEATVQVLGAQEKPTTIRGAWKDRFLREVATNGGLNLFTAVAEYNGRQVSGADDLVRKVDSIRRKGQLLEVRWGNQVRRGIMTDFTVNYDRVEDIEWEMTFGWVSQGDSPGAAVVSGQIDLGRVKSSWDQQADALVDSLTNPPFDIGSAEEQIESQAQDVNDRINEVTDAVASVATAVNDARDMATRLNSVYDSLEQSSTALIGTLTSAPPTELFVLSSADLQDGEPTFSATLRAQAWVAGVLTVARSIRRQAAEAQSEIAETISSDILFVYVAHNGEDLRDVSTNNYGTPDAWRRLMLFNQLSSSELFAGQVVLVPRLEAGDV